MSPGVYVAASGVLALISAPASMNDWSYAVDQLRAAAAAAPEPTATKLLTLISLPASMNDWNSAVQQLRAAVAAADSAPTVSTHAGLTTSTYWDGTFQVAAADGTIVTPRRMPLIAGPQGSCHERSVTPTWSR
jgi:hypothetical protein